MNFSFSQVISAVKKVLVPVLRIVSLGLIASPAGKIVGVAAEVIDKGADVAEEVSKDGDLNHAVDAAPAVIDAVKSVVKK